VKSVLKKSEPSIVMCVEDIRDVMAIENTGQYRGVYHVLGGKYLLLMGRSQSVANWNIGRKGKSWKCK
jgi:recombinational DNA repair protein RecR